MSGCLYTSPRLAADSSGLLGHILIILLLNSVATAEVLLLPITWLVGWCFSVMNLAESKKLLFEHLHTHCTCHKMYWRCNISWSYPYPGVCTFYMQCKVIFALCAVSGVLGPGFKRGFAKISQSRRRLLLRPFSGRKHLLVVSYKRHYAKQAPKHSK